MDGYTGDYNYSRWTPTDSTGTQYDAFRSAFKNIRFNVPVNSQVTITSANMANLPGIAFDALGDTSLWRALLAFNGIVDPLSDIAVGVVLKIPRKSDLIAYLSKQASNQQTSVTI